MATPDREGPFREAAFRDPARASAMSGAIAKAVSALGRSPVTVMHVCGSHEQAIAKYGLRAVLPRELHVIMGPGCPVCVTDAPEVDEGVALALQGVHVATYGDMLRVPGSSLSLADAQAEGARVHLVYSVDRAVDLARRTRGEVVFFATGFETTAVATAAAVSRGVPSNFSILCAHKYIPPAMDVVAGIPGSKVEGFLAAGHAATITGWSVFEPFVARHRLPVVVAGFEPLDILAALLRAVERIRAGSPRVDNVYPRCVTKDGNRRAQEAMWRVFERADGRWRGIGEVPGGSLRLREAFGGLDARRRFAIDATGLPTRTPRPDAAQCLCGAIMSGIASPGDCPLYADACTPEHPVGACMVSSEGTCRIWHEYGGHPDLGDIP
ncbi:MAG TPA: hydrogenase formation protein HypD, partial [Vicinamibacterales bacterium]|nr:hydrogenase formation protein HypD [Vicinamibacterales bacterium]HOQ61346.1 hydrogenase formation protein HypD [Vicinamibacterales bacterium]HPK72617.1 hydrogenase formation protein HypD [Vicinamibacterales bacterium]